MPRKKGVKNKEDAVEISVQTNESEESPIVEQKSVENRQLKNFLFIIGGALIAIFLFVFVGLPFSNHGLLNLVKELFGNQRLMNPLVVLPFVFHESIVECVF